jgi:hypothetical protein
MVVAGGGVVTGMVAVADQPGHATFATFFAFSKRSTRPHRAGKTPKTLQRLHVNGTLLNESHRHGLKTG